MNLLIPIFLWLEVIIFFAVGIPYLVKFIQLWRGGFKIKQMKLLGYGQGTIIAGIFFGAGFPQIIGIQNDFTNISQWTYVTLVAAGIFLSFIGLQLMLTSYKSTEETPRWIKKISNLWPGK